MTSQHSPSLELVGSVTDDQYLQAAHDVELQDGFAYTAGKGGQSYDYQSGAGGTFGIVNIVPPDSPQVVGGLDTLSNAQTVWPTGSICYVGDDEGVHAIDVSNPVDPTIVTRVTDPHLTEINGMARWGNVLLTVSKAGHIHAIDIQNPQDIRIIGSFETGLVAPHDIGLLRGHLIVTNYDPDHVSYENPEDDRQVAIIRAAKAGELLRPSEWTETAALTDQLLEGANRVVVRDPYLFVSTLVERAVVAINCVDPTAPSIVDSITGIGLSVGIAIGGPYLYQTTTKPAPFDGFDPTLNAIDISTPSAMSLVKSTIHSTCDVDFHDCEVYGRHLYVSGQGTNQLLIFELTDTRIAGLDSGSIRASSLHAEQTGVLTDVRIKGGYHQDASSNEARRHSG